MKFVNTENPKVLAFTRAYEDEIMLVVVNLSRYSQPAELDLSEYKGYKLVEVFSNNNFPTVKGDAPYFFTLSQYECQWFSLKDVSHPEHRESLSIIEIKKWGEAITGKVKETLENSILPDYLIKMRWFGGKARGIQGLRITGQSVININGNNVVMLLIEISYSSELPEIYQLPLTFTADAQAAVIKENFPKAIVCNAKVGSETGALSDALFSDALQQEIIKLMGSNAKVMATDGDEIIFAGNRHLKTYLKEKEKIKSRILAAEQSNTSIVYDSAYFLKLYRKVDRSINPDVEITRFLTEKAKFKHIPAFVGTIEWNSNNGSMVLGMMQEMVDNNTDGWSFMLDRLSSFNEKILSDPRLQMANADAKNTSIKPIAYDNLSTEVKELLEAPVTERVNLLGERTGEMHLALASSHEDTAFKPEPFSLHYQRSLFSSFQSLVRKTYQTLAKTLSKLPDDVRQEAEEVLQMRDEILLRFRAIYKKKFDVLKIRVHGDYHLGQTLFTGKDILIIDFEGEPAKTYSERRLKRAALRDVAGMIRSFHYAAYGSLFLNNSLHKEDIKKLVPYVEQWQRYMSGLYLQSYLHTVKDSMLVPKEKEDMQTMLQTYILEKAIYELNYELNNRPEWVIIPLRGIKAIMDQKYIN